MTKIQLQKAKLSGILFARYGIPATDAESLYRIQMTLHRWHERECGIDGGCIERDETTGTPYWKYDGGRYPIADREAGALKRLKAIMRGYPGIQAYVQRDPRGCALYVLRSSDLAGREVCSCYSSVGTAVCI